MTVIPTKRPLFGFYRIRAWYVRWSLGHVEESIKHAKDNLRLAQHEAERLRVELAVLEGL